MVKENNFWQGKKVLITGADGFIGSHLTESLLEKGADLSVFVMAKKASSFKKSREGNLDKAMDKISNVIEGDIGREESIVKIKENSPEVIFHLAAQAYVPFSFEKPMEVLRTNLIGTLNVLQSAMDLKQIERIVCTSSSEIYGTALTGKISETHALNPLSPYAASKLAADRYCYSYWKTYGLPIAVIRPFNTFGPRHTYDVIPKFIELALKNEPLTIHGDGKQSRDFTYVSDTVEGFQVMGSRKEAIGTAVNFGTGKDYTINETAEFIKKLSNSKSEIKHVDKRTADVKRLICDNDLAKKLFGWKPKVSFEEGLKKNIEWKKQRL